MRKVELSQNVHLLIVLAVVSLAKCCCAQGPSALNVLDTPTNSTTAIRFFFNPGDYFHAPLIMRVVSPRDARLDTAPMLAEGRTVYISTTEMEQLLKRLQGLDVSWKESPKRVRFGDPERIPPIYAMTVIVVSRRGTAQSEIDPTEICKELAQLDPALSTPRALWEFQEFGSEYKCVVPNFNGQAYPNHWSWNNRPGSRTEQHQK